MLASILSRARIAARRLSLPGVPDWLEKETDGYVTLEEVPGYRWVTGHREFLNPVHWWRPLIHEGRAPKVPLTLSVYDLEELLHMSRAGFLQMVARPVQLTEFGSSMTFQARFRIQNIDVS